MNREKMFRSGTDGYASDGYVMPPPVDYVAGGYEGYTNPGSYATDGGDAAPVRYTGYVSDYSPASPETPYTTGGDPDNYIELTPRHASGDLPATRYKTGNLPATNPVVVVTPVNYAPHNHDLTKPVEPAVNRLKRRRREQEG